MLRRDITLWFWHSFNVCIIISNTNILVIDFHCLLKEALITTHTFGSQTISKTNILLWTRVFFLCILLEKHRLKNIQKLFMIFKDGLSLSSYQTETKIFLLFHFTIFDLICNWYLPITIINGLWPMTTFAALNFVSLSKVSPLLIQLIMAVSKRPDAGISRESRFTYNLNTNLDPIVIFFRYEIITGSYLTLYFQRSLRSIITNCFVMIRFKSHTTS